MTLTIFFFFLLSTISFVTVIPYQKNLALKQYALGSSSFLFVLSLFLWVGFDSSTSKFQYVISSLLFPFVNFNIIIGVDGISLFFILLTTALFPICLLFSWSFVKTSVKSYLILFLVLEFILVTVFCCLDLLLFYIFFETALLPMFFVIGIWGSRQRKIRAAYLFFIYTLLSSLFMLIGITYIYNTVGSTCYEVLCVFFFKNKEQKFLWLSFFISFATKVPMIPVHIWLPEAHVEAPTGGSVILAAIFLKLGSYGFARFLLGIIPAGCCYYGPFIFCLCIFGIVYTSLTAIRQTDLKRLIAYTSIAHMNLIILGLFTFHFIGFEGFIVQSLSHGFVSSALFFLIGSLYERGHNRIIKNYSGLAHTMPLFVTIFLFFTMANLGLPGTSNFVGEFFLLFSTLETSLISCFFAALSLILCGCYSLWLFNRVAYGNLKKLYFDLDCKEFIVFSIFIFVTLYVGIFSNTLLKVIHISTTNLLEIYC